MATPSFLNGVAKECIGTNGLGTKYAELPCHMPTLGKLYLPFERFYDPVPALVWMQERPMIPIWACVLYVGFIVAGRSYFAKRPAWSWRKALAVWNFSLSLFSCIGAIRTAPALYYNLTTFPLREVMCAAPEERYGSGATGLWVQLFVLSKFPELFDTLFIVVHK
ncbi:hypothetical protein ACHAWF_000296, partial [Thalassiosira exigua]